jgi:hypothetical protein
MVLAPGAPVAPADYRGRQHEGVGQGWHEEAQNDEGYRQGTDGFGQADEESGEGEDHDPDD